MKELDPGHVYRLDGLKSKTEHELRFYKDAEINGSGHNGPSTQEVLRACIARVKFLNGQKPHRVNKEIIMHLRHSLVLFEARAMERAVEKEADVENWITNERGHVWGEKKGVGRLREDSNSAKKDSDHG